MPNDGKSKPGHTIDLKDSVKPSVMTSNVGSSRPNLLVEKTEIETSEQTALCINIKEPRCRRSGTGTDEPDFVRLHAKSAEAGQDMLRGDDKKPKRARSSTEMTKPKQAYDLAGKRLPKVTKSRTDSGKFIIVLDIVGNEESALQELWVDMEEPRSKKSNADNEKPDQALLEINTLKPI